MNKHSGFLELLEEPLKILSQKGKLLAITITIYLITTNSLSFRLLPNFSLNPFFQELVAMIFALVSTQPGTPEYTQLLVAIGISIGNKAAKFMVLLFLEMLLAQTSVIVIASSYYNGDSYSFIKHIMKVSTTWTRAFVTWFYVQLLTVGYTSFFVLLFLTTSHFLFDQREILITVLISVAILFIAFYIYSSVVWSLAIVVSVVEEDCYGLQALGKAREVVKGKRVHGILLTLLYLVVVLLVLVFGLKLSPEMPIDGWVIQTLVIGVVSMFQYMSYTAIYFQFKSKNDTIKSGALYKINVLLNKLFGSKVSLHIDLNLRVSGSGITQEGSEIMQENWLKMIVSVSEVVSTILNKRNITFKEIYEKFVK